MADNIRLDPGQDGDIVAADEVAGIKVPRVKLQFGIDGVAVDVSGIDPLPVVQTAGVLIANFPSTQDVQVGNFPALQDVVISAPVLVSAIVAPVDVSNFPATQDVSIVDSEIKVQVVEVGELFTLSQFAASLGMGSDMTFAFTTPASPSEIFMKIQASTGLTATLGFGEAATPGAGVVAVPINRNRDGGAASELTDVFSAAGGALGTILYETVSEAGGIAVPVFKLLPLTVYLVTLTSQDNNNPCSLNLTWREVS